MYVFIFTWVILVSIYMFILPDYDELKHQNLWNFMLKNYLTDRRRYNTYLYFFSNTIKSSNFIGAVRSALFGDFVLRGCSSSLQNLRHSGDTCGVVRIVMLTVCRFLFPVVVYRVVQFLRQSAILTASCRVES